MEKIVIEHFEERFQRGDYISWKREMELLPKDLEGRLLEVGCGPRLTYFPGKLEVCGVDITPELIKVFKKSYPNAHAIIGDAKMLPVKNESFDLIVSNMLLHHLVGINPTKCMDNIKSVMNEMKRVLKSDGMLFIREWIARNYVFSFIMFYFTLLCAKFGLEINSLDIRSKTITFFLNEKAFNKISLGIGFKTKEIESKDWKMPHTSNFPKIRIGRNVTFLLHISANQR